MWTIQIKIQRMPHCKSLLLFLDRRQNTGTDPRTSRARGAPPQTVSMCSQTDLQNGVAAYFLSMLRARHHADRPSSIPFYKAPDYTLLHNAVSRGFSPAGSMQPGWFLNNWEGQLQSHHLEYSCLPLLYTKVAFATKNGSLPKCQWHQCIKVQTIFL